MSRKYFIGIVIAAIICILLIFVFVWKEEHKPVPQAQIVTGPVSPFRSYIFGLGIVEASSGNISIGAAMNRIVDKVFVEVGKQVKKGDLLFKFDDRDLEIDLSTKEIEYQISQERLKKSEKSPRDVDVAPVESVVQNAQVELDQAKSQYEMAEGMQDIGAISQEEMNRRYYSYQQAQARLQQAQADLEKAKAGTWQPDLKIAQLETQLAEANVNRIKTEIERTIIRSPIDGTVLQIKIHEGELPPPDTSRTPIMILGNTDKMHVRVSINQFDAPYFRPQAPAVAYLQGDPRLKIPLEFVSLEPYLVNKQNVTNELTEQVDTRVLQVIYRLLSDHCFFIEQQLDVFIETEYTPENTNA